jgi:hypothetical protein
VFDNFNERANSLIAALKRKAVQGTEGHEPGGHLDENLDFRQCQRPNGSVYGTRGQCRKGTETQQEARGRAPKRFGDKEASKVAKRGQQATTKARAEKVLADLKPALPSKLEKLQRLASGKTALPKDKEQRKALYEAAHKRLGQLGNNPYNPQQRLDGKDPERQALSGLLRRLDHEFNPARRLTREQVLRAVGTVD